MYTRLTFNIYACNSATDFVKNAARFKILLIRYREINDFQSIKNAAKSIEFPVHRGHWAIKIKNHSLFICLISRPSQQFCQIIQKHHKNCLHGRNCNYSSDYSKYFGKFYIERFPQKVS